MPGLLQLTLIGLSLENRVVEAIFPSTSPSWVHYRIKCPCSTCAWVQGQQVPGSIGRSTMMSPGLSDHANQGIQASEI
ncbi:uncharacterized protein BO80DRAFT_267597 [Aspergillus ibericus CBS 121593]|uniref:CENP-V/GFA domain-containing protein n=1 Tax=Aspergillus ibericus CBS 121593 TaxID=1448316 RepID=A0A395H6Z6_9EURO|nr:hypothetical protein BO80DRAFT_267597 [Aspergillus ibericus CBS 121593]RAL03687.1 hypothetical protein BO80DRAFT_267597 [Aspergillus ibericus CBS 121593]